MNSLVKLLPLLALSSAYVIPRENDGQDQWYKTDKSTLRQETYKFIEDNANGLNIPGFTAVITSPKGDEIWSYGIRDKQGTPNDPKTFFGLASDSKLVGGVTLATIQEQGYILSNGETFQLNSLVKDVDPSFKMYNQTATDEATVNDFLAHYAGLPGHNWSLQPNDTNAAAFARLAHLKPNLGFRELWQYSSTGYMTLGHIVDKVTGRDFYELVNEIVYKPLGLEATDDASIARATGRLSQGFLRQDLNATQCGLDLIALNETLTANSTIQQGEYPVTLTSLAPESCIGRQESMEYWTNGTGREWGAGGSSVMTGEDILKWIKEVLNPQHISPSVIETVNHGLVNISNIPPTKSGPPSQYAIGTITRDYQGYDARLHDGALPGSNSFFIRVHNESIGVFVVGSEDYYTSMWYPAVAQTILDDLLGLPVSDHFTPGLVSANAVLTIAQSATAEPSTNGTDGSTESVSNPSATRRQVEQVNVDEWVGKTFSAPGYLPFTLEPLNITDAQGTLDEYGFPIDFLLTDVISQTYIPITGPALIAQYGASFCSHIVFTHVEGPYWNATGALVWDRVQTDSDVEGTSPKIAKLTGAAPAVFADNGIGLFGGILTINPEAGVVETTTENLAEVAPLFYALVDE